MKTQSWKISQGNFELASQVSSGLSFPIECSKSSPGGGGGGGEASLLTNDGDVKPMDSRTGYHFGLGSGDWVSFLLRSIVNIAFLSKFNSNLYGVFSLPH